MDKLYKYISERMWLQRLYKKLRIGKSKRRENRLVCTCLGLED